MSPLSLNNAATGTLVEKLVMARKLYGSDSSYVIGMMAGVEMVLDNDGNLREIQDRVVEVETGKAPSAKPAQEAPRGGRGDSVLIENSWTKGSVKWFNNDKGYGFISTGAETDVFVHWRDISSWDRSLSQGDEVEFMVTKTAKGFQAINVMKSSEDQEKEGEGGSPPAVPRANAVSSDSEDSHASSPNPIESGVSDEGDVISGTQAPPGEGHASQEVGDETGAKTDESRRSLPDGENQESEVPGTAESPSGNLESPPGKGEESQ